MGDRLSTTDKGRKLGAVPLVGGGAGALYNTMWPQDIQDRAGQRDNGLIA